MRAILIVCLSIAMLSGCESSPNDDVITIDDDTPTRELSARDREFIRQATIGGLFEIKSSEWALDQDVKSDLREAARMIIDDHIAANAELKALAAKKGVTVPDSLDSEHQSMLRELRQTASGRVDDVYIEQQISAHRDAIALFQEVAQGAGDTELRAFARRTLPTLRKHLAQLKELD